MRARPTTRSIARASWRAVVATLIALMATTFVPPVARANGRFPDAQFLVGSSDGRVLTLATTFGVLVSNDAGLHFHWVCEAALGLSPGTIFDYALLLTRDTTLIVSLPSGVALSDPALCDFTYPSSAPIQRVLDLTGDPRGESLVALFADGFGVDGLSVSHDRGASWHPAWSSGDWFVTTVDVAPGMSQRMYLSANGPMSDGATAGWALLRSDDGGSTFSVATPSLDRAASAFIAGVDPTAPDTVYVRVNRTDGRSALMRTTDGGGSFITLLTITTRMLGFALSADGRTVWAAGQGPSEGIYRLDPGASTFQIVSQGFHPRCLRVIAGRLFACAGQTEDGYALAVSDDLGATFTPLLRLQDLLGPDACDPASGVASKCAAAWPAQHDLLRETRDSGIALDATAIADAPSDAIDERPRSNAGCGCTVPTQNAHAAISGAFFFALAALRQRRDRRRAMDVR